MRGARSTATGKESRRSSDAPAACPDAVPTGIPAEVTRPTAELLMLNTRLPGCRSVGKLRIISAMRKRTTRDFTTSPTAESGMYFGLPVVPDVPMNADALPGNRTPSAPSCMRSEASA